MKRIFVMILILYPFTLPAGIKDTMHNLSVSGPGSVKAVEEKQICIFCHTPHRGVPGTPLWSRDLSYQEGIQYKMPSRSTLSVKPGQPTGATKLCLSCHDGTIAIGMIRPRKNIIKITDQGKGLLSTEGRFLPGKRGFIGTDLSGSHPVSVRIDDSITMMREARGLSPLKPVSQMKSDPDGVKLDKNDEIQCTTCHDPHDDKNYITSGIHFWRKARWSDVCIVCHDF